jgi:FkbM family methyltransferase
MSVRFTHGARLGFYLRYAARKLFALWFEVRRPRLRMFLYELLYSSAKLLGREILLPSPFGVDFVETRFGRFRIRPRTVDLSAVSPAFERDDLDRLLALLARLLDGGKKVLFLDVGADLGTYTVSVGNRFRESLNLRILAFEPVPESHRLLVQNIALNGLTGMAHAHQAALWSREGREIEFHYNPRSPGSSGPRLEADVKFAVLTRTMDALALEGAVAADALVMKLDVEGAETEVLEGARDILALGKEVHLLVEDFINPAVVEHLERIGARLVTKLTPYNSFWYIRPAALGEARRTNPPV